MNEKKSDWRLDMPPPTSRVPAVVKHELATALSESATGPQETMALRCLAAVSEEVWRRAALASSGTWLPEFRSAGGWLVVDWWFPRGRLSVGFDSRGSAVFQNLFADGSTNSPNFAASDAAAAR